MCKYAQMCPNIDNLRENDIFGLLKYENEHASIIIAYIFIYFDYYKKCSKIGKEVCVKI